MAVTREFSGTYKSGFLPSHLDHKGSMTSNNTLHSQESIPGPWAPRFRVTSYELSDAEWRAEIEESFTEADLVPFPLKKPPGGLINLSWGLHDCVHMGNTLPLGITRNKPDQMSWPVSERGGLHSLLMVEVRSGSLGWLVTSLPGTNVSAGLTIMDYTQHQADTSEEDPV